MTQIYAVSNLSGSVGKTTTAVNLGIMSAAQGLRTTIIDLDPQANASTQLGYPEYQGQAIADVMRHQFKFDEAKVPARIVEYVDEGTGIPVYNDDPEYRIANLSIVPAGRSTLTQLMVELSAAGLDGFMRLRDVLETAEPADVVIIDSPGTPSSLVENALIATSLDENAGPGNWGVITCTKPAGKESEGIQMLRKELSTIKRTFRIDIPLLAIVPCAVMSRGNFYTEQLGYLEAGFGDRVTPKVRHSIIVDEAYTNFLPVSLFGYRAKHVIEDYEKVFTHLRERHGLFRPAAVNA